MTNMAIVKMLLVRCLRIRTQGSSGKNDSKNFSKISQKQIFNNFIFSSPTIPNTEVYPNHCDCEYTIGKSLAGQYAEIKFNFMKMHIENKCTKDFVQIKERDRVLKFLFCLKFTPYKSQQRRS